MTRRRWWAGGWKAVAVTLAALATWTPRTASAAWPTLDAALARARERGLAVTSAKGELNVARGTEQGARVSILQNPYLEVQMQGSKATDGININAFTFLPLELNGQRGARIGEADKFIAWRQQGLIDAQARIIGDVLMVYGEVITAASRVEDAERAEQDARTEVQFITARRQVGDATIFDQSLAEAEVARWSQTRAEATVLLARARGRLAELMGDATVEAPPKGAGAHLPQVQGTWSEAGVAALAEQAPVLRATRAESAYYDANRERLERDKFQAFNLIINGGRGDVGEARFGGGLSWTFPITRRNQGEIAVAEAHRDRAAAVAGTLRPVIEARARAAYEAFETSRAAVNEQDTVGIPAAQKVVDAAFTSYRAGKGELLRVYIARRDLVIARFRRLDLVMAAWSAYGELAALKGTLP